MVFNPNSPRKVRMEFDKSISNNGPTGSSSVRLSSKNKFQIGNQAINDISFIEIPSADFWDGVSGLRKNITRIDYGRRKIYFYNYSFKPAEKAVALKINYVLGVLTVALKWMG